MFGSSYWGTSYWGGSFWGGTAVVVTQLFEEALLARLLAITEITDIVGTAIYVGAIPQTYDLGAAGPALTYSVPTKPRGHDLGGSDGTAVARIQLDAWSYSQSTVRTLIDAIDNGIGGKPVETSWGNGTCRIVSVVHQNELDADEPPSVGSDRPVFHTLAEYQVRYRVSIPTLS